MLPVSKQSCVVQIERTMPRILRACTSAVSTLREIEGLAAEKQCALAQLQHSEQVNVALTLALNFVGFASHTIF